MKEDIQRILDKLDQGEKLTPAEVAKLRTAQGVEEAIQTAAEADRPDLEAQVERIAGLVTDSVMQKLQAQPGLKGFNHNAPAKEPEADGHKLYSGLIRGLVEGTPRRELVEKAMTIGSAADGGYLVPTVTAAEIMRYVGEYGSARRNARVVPTSVGSLKLNTRDGGMTAYYTTYNSSGTVAGEQTDITVSAPTYSQVTLVPATLATLSDPLSMELVQDSDADLFQEIAIEAAEAMAIKEDNTVFNGTGAGTADGGFTGVLGHASVNVITITGTVEQLTYDNLVDVPFKIPSVRLNGAKWYMHRTVMAVIAKLKDDNGAPLFIPSMQPGIPGTLFGYPVELAEGMPTLSAVAAGEKFAFLGDLKGVTIYDRQQVDVKILDQATVDSVNLATANGLAARHTMRHMVIVRRPASFVALKLAA